MKPLPRYTVADPTHCDEEVLPTSWQDYAEAKGLRDDHLWRSWRRFKDFYRLPWRRDLWQRWVNNERLPTRR